MIYTLRRGLEYCKRLPLTGNAIQYLTNSKVLNSTQRLEGLLETKLKEVSK